MIQDDNRTRLYTLIPTDVTYRTVALIIFFGGIGIFGLTSDLDANAKKETWGFLLIVIGVIALATAFQIYINKGYRVSYDEVALYLRPDGINWNLRYKADTVMRYDDIGEIYADAGNMKLAPFEFIEIQRKGWDGEERFFLSRIFLRENQLKDLLRFMHGKIPDKFPQDIIDYMGAEPGWIEQQQMKARD